MRKWLLLTGLSIVTVSQLFSQTTVGTRVSSLSSDSSAAFYFSSQREELPVYSGRQHYGYAASIEGHAYHFVNEWQKGSVMFDQVWYHNMMLMFDVYKEELVVRHPSGISFTLFSDRIQEFLLADMHFFYENGKSDNGLKKGFYQKLANGPLTILARRSKKLDEKIFGTVLEQKFLVEDQYYAQKDGVSKLIRRQNDILGMLGSDRSAVQAHLKSQGIKYKTSPESALIQIAQFYNNSKQ